MQDFWIASRSLSSGAHSRDPLARNDNEYYPQPAAMPPSTVKITPDV